jgi:hypothetical protein
MRRGSDHEYLDPRAKKGFSWEVQLLGYVRSKDTFSLLLYSNKQLIRKWKKSSIDH